MREKTKISILPVTLGVKYFFPPMGRRVPINFYVASGMKYYFVHTHNDSSFVEQNIHAHGMGGMVEGGLIAVLKQHLVLDLFASGSFKTLKGPSKSPPTAEGTSLNVSSFNIGGGIGYKY